MNIVLFVTIITSLFLVIGCVEPLAAALKIPLTVLLTVIGIGIGIGSGIMLETELTDALNPMAEALLNFPVHSDVLLYVFLPTLLFQATLDMALRPMLDDWVPILLMAVVAVVATTVSIGYALVWASGLSLAVCLLIGAIVSTTDPSAVVSIFRSIAAPRRLARIVEGESLLNDAVAIALFGLFMGYVMPDTPDPSLQEALRRFPILIVGGVLTGWITARIALWLMTMFQLHERAVVSISIALPYFAYIGAEQSLGASGVIAVVTAGATLNLLGPIRMSPTSWAYLEEVWSVLAHWSGALIFVLAALLVPRLLADTRIEEFGLVVLMVIAALAARILILFVLLPALSVVKLSPTIDRSYRIAILWGGLRGAVTLALALAVTESTAVSGEVKRVVGILATGFVLFTMIVQGTTLRVVIRWLGLDRLSERDTALSQQVIAVSLQSVREEVARTATNYHFTPSIVRAEAQRLEERIDEALQASEGDTDILDRDRVNLALVALARAERDTIVERLRDRVFPSQVAIQILSNADRLLEATRTDGRIGYRRVARHNVRFGRVHRFALWLHNTFQWSMPLARLTESRIALVQTQRVLVRDLDRFIDTRIRRLHGQRVAEILHELLAQRRKRLEGLLEGLRLQFPGYAEELERRFVQRIELQLEEREYTIMSENRLVGAEIHASLMLKLAEQRRATEALPPLDLAVQRSDLIGRFPLFTAMEKPVLKRIERTLRTRYVEAGTLILERDEPARGVYFIATGAVESRTDDGSYQLGPGGMFGQIRMLADWSVALEVRAMVPSTLLFLDEAQFLQLLAESTRIRDAVRESARNLGIDPELLLDKHPA